MPSPSLARHWLPMGALLMVSAVACTTPSTPAADQAPLPGAATTANSEAGTSEDLACEPLPDDGPGLICTPPEGILRITPDGVLDWGRAEGLRVTGIAGSAVQTEAAAVPVRASPPDDAIPDSHLVRSATGLAAYVADPTERYSHAILGDPVEGQSVVILDDSDTEVARFATPSGTVIEDLAPRFADLDGDGDDEVVVVITDEEAGATVGVIDVVPAAGTAVLLAQTAPIGLPGRWLNPLPPVDIDGDGDAEVAYVETPHAGGTLIVLDLVDGVLSEVARAPGYSNHAIRTTEQALSLSLTGPDGAVGFLVPRDGRESLALLDAHDPSSVLADVALPNPVRTAVVTVPGGMVVGLDSGQVLALPLPLPGTTLG